MKKMLVTTALPYANGPIHLGHLVEYIQADIWVRFQRLQGIDCLFIGGDDAHGTPIMISAEQQGVTPEELIKRIYKEHVEDLKQFYISFDHYYTTHSPENEALSTLIYNRLKERDNITTRTITQAFDPIKQMFLPDRYVKGECPRCGAKGQYGDNCEACGATYSPSELKNPISILSGATPIEKESLHYFFKLEDYQEMLREWLQENHVQIQIKKKLLEWFEAGLAQWDISRDSPYFGFEIPDAPGKFFYVWLDAPIGYMASFQNFCHHHPEVSFDDYWSEQANSELYHFVGKDIIYFHALFWPAILAGSGFRLPTAIYTHGFLTINGQKMSKSRGTFITAKKYLSLLEPEYLRYYFAAKLGSGIEDIDFNLEDFCQRVNAELVGKVINIASRCAGFIAKYFNYQLATSLPTHDLFDYFVQAGEKIAGLYHSRDYNQAIREIMSLADLANQYIEEMKPWTLAKQEETRPLTQSICTLGLNFFRILVIYLKPILPIVAAKTEIFLNSKNLFWQDRKNPLLNHTISVFKPLMQRIDLNQVIEFFPNSEKHNKVIEKINEKAEFTEK
jgi:methionyl-tRNA synthetase